MRAMLATVLAMSVVGAATGAPDGRLPQFELVQPDLFSAPGGQANAWADFDGDGDLDEFVGFRGRPNRLYRQDHGVFSDVAAAAGLADTVETRAAAWGDFDNDGDADLYVGFAGGTPNKLYRNDGGHFTDVAREVGVNLTGVSRQAAFIDYDNDGDLDLFAAFRERPNQLFRNDGGRLVNVTESSGIGDPRKTVGAVWFDADRDGDLDLFVANQDGDLNALFLNDRGHFTDVAAAWGVDGGPRSTGFGGVGPAVADYDGDGFFDLFVANYGPSVLYRNERGRRFTDVTRAAGASFEGHAVTASWGDYDNDGRPDLYVSGFLANEPHYPDHLLHQDGAKDVHFSDVMPDLLKTHDASHGVQWIDFDNDGALDLALANNDPQGGHYLFHNRLAADRTHASLSVDVVDSRGRHTKPGAEVRVYAGGRRLVSSALLDTGSGYCSQNSMPVHVGVAGEAKVDVEVTVLTTSGRRTFTRKGVNSRTAARPLVITAPD